jgi:geranylgeranyl reductase family protein
MRRKPRVMITVAGAGPSGSYLAYLLAKNRKSVEVIEEHKEIGKPVQCAGITSERLKDFFDEREMKRFLVNKINAAKIFSPNGKFVKVKLKENFIIDRIRFDKYLAEKAKRAGAKYYLESEFVGIEKEENNKLIIKIKTKNKIIKKTTNILVGADGPLSQVAKSAGLFKKRDFFIGMQARTKIKNSNIVEFFLFPKGIAWIIPENKSIVRVGVAAKHNANYFFRKFLEKKAGKNFKKMVIEYNAGVIPVYNPRIKAQKNKKIFLVGDAATMTKATTLGGIVQGLTAAEALADSISNEKNYDERWRKKIGKSLLVSLMIRKAMNKFSEKELNDLIRILSEKKNRKLLERFDREAPAKSILKLAITEPRLLQFARFFCLII